jgi:hypothetical protein
MTENNRLFRKKPVVIEAVQYTGHNGHEIENWTSNKAIESPVLEPTPDNPRGCYLQIKTLEGWMTAIQNDWIIKGVKGEFYPCKPDIFEMTYEPALSFEAGRASGKLPTKEDIARVITWEAGVDFDSLPDRWKQYNLTTASAILALIEQVKEK